MANNERLTKRVKTMEDWIAENEEIGGPQGTLDTFNFLVAEMRALAQTANATQKNMETFRSITFEFIKEHDLVEDWDKFVQEKTDGEQKNEAEEEAVETSEESSEKKD